MFTDFIKSLFDPIILTAIATVIGTGLLVLTYIKKRQLFRPTRIEINEISIKPVVSNGMGGFISNPHIKIDVYNPSNLQNLIISYTLKVLPFCKLIHQNKANITLEKYSKEPMHIGIDYELANKYKNKRVKLTLTDIKQRKTTKTFKLIDKS